MSDDTDPASFSKLLHLGCGAALNQRHQHQHQHQSQNQHHHCHHRNHHLLFLCKGHNCRLSKGLLQRLRFLIVAISFLLTFASTIPSATASALHPIKFKTEEAFRAHGHHEETRNVADMTEKLDRLRKARNWKKWNLRNPEVKDRLDKLLDMSYGGASKSKKKMKSTKEEKSASFESPASSSSLGGDIYRHHKPPNILFILADDLGYGDLSVLPFVTKYSADWPCDEGGILSPRLEEMAKKGLIMTNFHSAAPVCSPSRVAFMTGVSPWR